MLLIITLIALFLPILQSRFNIIKLYDLAGDDKLKNDTTLTIENYFSEAYQKKKSRQLSSSFGFRSLLIKLNNQIYFSLFNKVNAKDVIVGKENYLFETTYINSYLGLDFIGKDSINRSLRRMKNISDKLLRLNKHLILVIAPSKPSYYREFLPDNYSTKTNETNYKYISIGLKKHELTHIDFSYWFNQMKHTAKFPLYPKHGNHWSMYGSYLAADSIIKLIELKRKIDIPNLQIKNIKMESPKNDDNDIGYGINLLFKLKSFNLAYPEVITEDTAGKTKPNVLVIGDSFYWNLSTLGITNSFNHTSFWYYNKAIYDVNSNGLGLVDDLNFSNEIKKYDIIIILATESNLKKIGWGFIDKAENYLY